MRGCYPGSSSSFFRILLLFLITSALLSRPFVASLQPAHLFGVGRVGGDLLSEQRLHVLRLLILLFAGVVDDLFNLNINLLVLGLGILG